MSFLTWENLVVGHKEKEPLNFPFSGRICDPGIYAVSGQNGCGKSTLMKTWLNLAKPLKGSIFLHDRPFPKSRDIFQGVTYVPQFLSVNKFFHITVKDFVRQGYGPNYRPSKAYEKQISQALEEWQLAGYEDKSFHELSGGQRTRVLIARAILSKPRILFLDEPLASLDSCCQFQLITTLQIMTERDQVCVIVVDHHLQRFKNYISASIVFSREHDKEISTIHFERNKDDNPF
ncbi:MAG: ATP-binding cassette domain-containing protein [Silvanigrellaceae bacterium]|nr:ATP-binding cassette domain-containing protein [Silvanigrellaceae bacterium]